MKGLLLSFLLFILYVLLSVPVLRRFKGRKYFKPLFLELVVILGLYSLSFYYAPGYFSPTPFIEFANGFIIVTVLAICFLNLIYGSFLTGFSTGMLMWMLKKQQEGITQEELLNAYGYQSAMDHVVGPRLKNLLQGKYIQEEAKGYFSLLPKGLMLAKIAHGIKKLLNMGRGG